MRQNDSKMKKIMILHVFFVVVVVVFLLKTVKALTGRQVLRCLISTYTVSHSPFYRMLCKTGLTKPYILSVYFSCLRITCGVKTLCVASCQQLTALTDHKFENNLFILRT